MAGYNPKILDADNQELLRLHNGKPYCFAGPIETMTNSNNAFRKVVYTGTKMQLVLMTLTAGQTIDREVHPAADQFFRVENGSMIIKVEDPNETLEAKAGDAIIVTAGTYHTVIAGPLGVKLYTVYSPANHPHDRVQITKPEIDD